MECLLQCSPSGTSRELHRCSPITTPSITGTAITTHPITTTTPSGVGIVAVIERVWCQVPSCVVGCGRYTGIRRGAFCSRVIPHGSHNHGSLSLSTPIPPPSQSPPSPSSHLHPLLAPSTQQYSSTIALPVDWLHELQNEPVPERWIHNTPSPTIKKRCKRREHASLEWGRPRTYTNVQAM